MHPGFQLIRSVSQLVNDRDRRDGYHRENAQVERWPLSTSYLHLGILPLSCAICAIHHISRIAKGVMFVSTRPSQFPRERHQSSDYLLLGTTYMQFYLRYCIIGHQTSVDTPNDIAAGRPGIGCELLVAMF